MLVKCLKTKPDERQRKELGSYYNDFLANHDSHLIVDREYLVLGLIINASFERMAMGVSVIVLCDYGHIENYPIALFEVLDGTVDPEWLLRADAQGFLEIAPELLHSDHFVEDYSERIPEVRSAFDELFRRMTSRQPALKGRTIH